MDKQMMGQPLAKLDFSEEFLAASKRMGYRTLDEIIADGPEGLVNRDGFSYHWLSELSRYLDKKDALHLLQTIQGSSLS